MPHKQLQFRLFVADVQENARGRDLNISAGTGILNGRHYYSY